METLNQFVELPILKEKKVSLAIKREDRIHPFISGNKFRKLKYNLLQASLEGYDTILTFGGAFSNHIAATAYAGKVSGFKTIGVIRGEELQGKWQANPTLQLAHQHGMQFHFMTRAAYRMKAHSVEIKKMEALFGRFYLLPEGGSNHLAVKGCEEILTARDVDFDTVCVAVGTGGTIAGISNSATNTQRILGFPALRGDFLKEDIRKFTQRKNWSLQCDYHFGGYAKTSKELIAFINTFKREAHMLLDPIYTAKMVFGILDMVKNNKFQPETKILAIHTGGLQSIESMNMKLKKKNLPLIHL